MTSKRHHMLGMTSRCLNWWSLCLRKTIIYAPQLRSVSFIQVSSTKVVTQKKKFRVLHNLQTYYVIFDQRSSRADSIKYWTLSSDMILFLLHLTTFEYHNHSFDQVLPLLYNLSKRGCWTGGNGDKLWKNSKRNQPYSCGYRQSY